MIILKLLIEFAVIFFANIVLSSTIVEALPTFPTEILNQFLNNKSVINGTLTQEQITEV